MEILKTPQVRILVVVFLVIFCALASGLTDDWLKHWHPKAHKTIELISLAFIFVLLGLDLFKFIARKLKHQIPGA